METKKKAGFFKRNKEKLKIGGIVGISLTSIGAIASIVALHIVNPAIGAFTIPFAIQILITTLVKKFPKNLDEAKAVASELLKDAPEDIRDKFLDELSSQYSSRAVSSRTIASTEPIEQQLPTPSETEEVYFPARRHIRTGTYDLYTPRPVTQSK